MKTSEFIQPFLRQHPEAKPIDIHAPLSASLKEAASHIVRVLLEEEPLTKTPICEAAVYRARRSKIWVATFTGPTGGQMWKTTGLTDYHEALMLALLWEGRARAQRARLGRTTSKPRTRVRHAEPGTVSLTQKQVAQILRLSERGVREIERRAFWKLRHHPKLKELWQQYLSGNLDEACFMLTPAEIEALFDTAGTLEELHLIEKLLWIIKH